MLSRTFLLLLGRELRPENRLGNVFPNLLHRPADNLGDIGRWPLGGARPVDGARALALQFQRGHPLARNADCFAQIVPVAGKDGDLLPSARGGDVEQFPVHPVAGNNDLIDRLALRLVGGNGVAVRELPEIVGEGALVFENDAALFVHGLDFDAFAVGEL